MSMRSSFVYGMGFEVDKVKISTIVDFIKNHKETFCQSETDKKIYNTMLDELDNMEDIYDLDDYFTDEMYSCDVSGQEGLGAVISNIMSAETGIRFEFQRGQDDCGSVPTVMFSDAPAWCYNEAEKCLTEDKFMEVCDKYMQELEIEGRADYMEVEYYG